MKNIGNVLIMIRENPEKYIGRKSLKLLDLFICGYVLSEGSEKEYADYFSSFQDFIQEKYHISLAKSSAEIIRFHVSSDSIAFDEFYKLLEEFNNRGEKT